MARTPLTVQQISLAGITPSFSAGDQANGHEFVNDGACYLEVKNTGGGICTVTVLTPAKVSGMDVAELTVSVPATNGNKKIGPFPTRIFNQAGGLVYVDLSTATGVTLGAFRLG